MSAKAFRVDGAQMPMGCWPVSIFRDLPLWNWKLRIGLVVGGSIFLWGMGGVMLPCEILMQSICMAGMFACSNALSCGPWMREGTGWQLDV